MVPCAACSPSWILVTRLFSFSSVDWAVRDENALLPEEAFTTQLAGQRSKVLAVTRSLGTCPHCSPSCESRWNTMLEAPLQDRRIRLSATT